MNKTRRPRRAVSGILLLDKPPGLSSNAALQHVKRLYQADKAGHTGSLDPLATGVLPICLGEATKLSGVLLDADKCYRARARLGARTSTGDLEGEIVETSRQPVDRAALLAVLPRFRGTIRQVPPMYSALKHEGQRLYALARQGVEVERAPREVTIHTLELEDFSGDGFVLFIRCSKGTYIRTLVEDIARAAGQCAHLIALRRTAVTPFDDDRPVTLEMLEATARTGGLAALDQLLLDPAAGVRHWPQIRIDAVRASYLAQGQAVRVAGIVRNSRLAVLDEAGRLLGLAETTDEGMVAPRRWLRPVHGAL
ncbi:tRNA pseudouridine synthase B [Fontimonas thermophila]|uniref:tRNA pseudouridine synthase B n=1 Tax=Fontimonas thermophila TaxID=1076937 RepID=A0A1I2HXF9_9GAMM|nr:tRNA pseudouridine(55) synthase TruB [Fontimonas thermophila]SFF34050.1 tRNA pseudouridine synthase B [Fontimonas thermophila]